MGGNYMIPLNADHRAGAGINGDEVDVDLEFDTEPREVAITSGLLQSQKIKVIQ
jgi:hypothetical protein